jgi:rubrerythrin
MRRNNRTTKIRFIHENFRSKTNGKRIPKSKLSRLSDADLDVLIAKAQPMYEQFLRTTDYIVSITEQNEQTTEWYDWGAESEDEIREALDSKYSNLKRIQIAEAKNHHFCKYCGTVTEGANKDVLCSGCHDLFGHTLYSEL